MAFKTIALDIEEKIALITLNRPEVLNALNTLTLQELQAVFTALEENRDVRVIIITGSGKAFAAGADISEMNHFTPDDAARFSRLGHATMDAIQNAGKPVIAAVNGYALGGGLELALACDLIIASEGSLLGMPELNLGIIQGFGGTQRLPRLVGKARAKELIFTGDAVTAQRACEMGMVNKVAEPGQLLVQARKLAETIMQKGPAALRLAKRVIDRGYDETLAAGCAMEIQSFIESFATPEREEGMKAFGEKRKPLF